MEPYGLSLRRSPPSGLGPSCAPSFSFVPLTDASPPGRPDPFVTRSSSAASSSPRDLPLPIAQLGAYGLEIAAREKDQLPEVAVGRRMVEEPQVGDALEQRTRRQFGVGPLRVGDHGESAAERFAPASRDFVKEPHRTLRPRRQLQPNPGRQVARPAQLLQPDSEHPVPDLRGRLCEWHLPSPQRPECGQQLGVQFIDLRRGEQPSLTAGFVCKVVIRDAGQRPQRNVIPVAGGEDERERQKA